MLMQVSDKPFSSRAQSTHGNSHPGHHALSYATRKSLFSEDRFDELWRSIGQVSNMFALKPKCDHRRQVKISLWVAQRRTHWPLGELCVNQHVHLVTFQKKSHFCFAPNWVTFHNLKWWKLLLQASPHTHAKHTGGSGPKSIVWLQCHLSVQQFNQSLITPKKGPVTVFSFDVNQVCPTAGEPCSTSTDW